MFGLFPKEFYFCNSKMESLDNYKITSEKMKGVAILF